jgi:hypothetical protein
MPERGKMAATACQLCSSGTAYVHCDKCNAFVCTNCIDYVSGQKVCKKCSGKPVSAAKKTSWTQSMPLIAVGLFMIIGYLAFRDCAVSSPTSRIEPKSAQVEEELYKIQYRIAGNCKYANITIQTPDGMEQRTAKVPSTTESYVFKRGGFAYISAQNQGLGGSRVEVEILSNGVSLKKATSYGEYAIASVDWSVGSNR